MQIISRFGCGFAATLLLGCSIVGCSNSAVVVDEAEFAKKVDTEERAQRKREEAALASQPPAQAEPPAPVENTGVNEERARAGRN